ncbi:tape measure protein [Pirellulaceae bacterium SH467]
MAGTINAANISIGFDGSKLRAGEELTRSSLNTIRQNMSRSLSDNERYRAEMAQLGIALNKGAIDQGRYGEAVEFVSKKYGIITPLVQRQIDAERREAEEKQRKIALQKQEDAELQRHIALTRSVETATERHTRQMREYHAELRRGVIDHETYNRLVRQSAKDMNAKGGAFGSGTVGGFAVGTALGSTAAGIGYGAIDWIKSATTDTFKLAAQVETATVAFEVLTQSADQAKKLVGDIRSLDQRSTLSFIDIQQGAKTMLGYGVAVKEVMPSLEALSKVSMGNADVFQRLSLAFSQTMAKGKLAGEEVRQMVNAGFNPLQAVAEKLSKTVGGSTTEHMAKLNKLMEEGAISARVFQDSLQFATEGVGRFALMNEKQLGTVQGKYNKLLSETEVFKTKLGQLFEPMTKMVLDFANANAKSASENPWTAGIGGFGGAAALFAGQKSSPIPDMVADYEKQAALSESDLKKLLNEQNERAKNEQAIKEHSENTLSQLHKANLMLKREELNTIEMQIDKMKELREEELRRRGQRSPDLLKIDEAIAALQKANAENLAAKAAEQRQKDEEFNARAKERQEEIRRRSGERMVDENKNFQKWMKDASNPQNLSNNVAPAVKAGTAEAYKFLIDRQEKISSRAEQIAEKSAQHLERIAKINEEMKRDLEKAPRIVKVGP